jgi:hypothetical protein
VAPITVAFLKRPKNMIELQQFEFEQNYANKRQLTEKPIEPKQSYEIT